MDNIDDIMGDQVERESRENADNSDNRASKEILDIVSGGGEEDVLNEEMTEEQEGAPVGFVDHFYDKINVVAIRLKGSLKVGDMVEIVDDGERFRFRVSSMQINREDVEEAGDGDDVGIKVDRQVSAGSKVYLIDS